MAGSYFYKVIDSLKAVEVMQPSHDHFFLVVPIFVTVEFRWCSAREGDDFCSD